MDMTDAPTLAHEQGEFYGNQQIRLEELRTTSYEEFKNLLIETHNTHPQAEVETSFVGAQNGTLGGGLYPRAQDKDMLMAYALEQAQEQANVQVAALILGTAIVAIHPFEDGNGRTSRTIYSALSRGLDDASPEHQKVRLGGKGDIIDFSGVSREPYELAQKLAYQEAGVTKLASQTWYLSQDTEASKKHYGEREFHGLTSDERAELDGLLGEKNGSEERGDVGRYGGLDDSLLFGFSKVSEELGLDLPINHFSHGRTAVNVPDALMLMDGDAKRKLFEYIQQYHTLKAKAAIDLVGKNGEEVIETDQGAIAIRDYLLTQTNNYLALKLTRKPKTPNQAA
jgi:hypothetical protein